MNTTAEFVWGKTLSFIEDNISREAFVTWFAPIKPVQLKDSALTIQVPSKFFYEWLEEHYLKLLKVALRKELGPDAKLIYSIVMEKKPTNKKPYTLDIPSTNKRKFRPQEVASPLNSKSKEVRNPFIIPGLQKLKVDSQLNNNYTFDNFIEGEYNSLPRSAGKAIAKRPGETAFNPLFIYGSVGLGKTHLVHAIGNEAKELNPEKTVLYVSMEKFTQQFIDAVKNNNRNDFVHFYQMIDLLIVDDVHFLSGKKATQDVFFHIFNHLHQAGNQLILTSDKSPADMQDVEQRLVSRFKWGLSADLQTPDLETRISILKYKIESDGIQMPEDVIEYIAKNVKSNIRELEGALISIIAQASLNKKEITLSLAEQKLSNFISVSKKEITIDYIQKTVCDYFKVDLKDVQSKTRKRDIVQARQLAMFFAKKYTKASLASIGNQIGNRDHATVLHAVKTVRNLKETDKVYRSYVDELQKRISND